jgi:hypothetical protein
VVGRGAIAAGGLALFAGCSAGGGGPSAFQIRRTHVAVAATTPIAISGTHLAFLADEATTGPGGTDMNGDGDATDSIAFVVDMSSAVETNLGVAATAVAWAGGELYLTVDESLDGRDWNGDADTDDLVLLHVSTAHPERTPDFVDVLSPTGATKMVGVGTRLYYSSALVPANPFDSNLFVLTSSAPTTPSMVPTLDAAGPLSPKLLAKDEGLLFLTLDETAEGRDLNGDADALDRSVLALLDGTAGGETIRSTGLALPATSPLRARKKAAHDWDVGFLVSENDQGATNLNDPALFSPGWQPSQCTGSEDTDARDSVLFFLGFAAWSSDPLANPPVNTGLVGSRKIAIAGGYIATITPEHDAADPNGSEGDCDLNGDGDLLDHVVRWVRMDTTVLPLTNAADLHALTDVPGGTHGLAELGSRFVIEVSESGDDLDINLDGLKTFDYLGWLLPTGNGSSSTPWVFTHGQTHLTTFGGSWMAETPDRSRLAVAMQEASYGSLGSAGANLNAHDPPLPGEDLDQLDSVPVFAQFTGTVPFLDLPGATVAVKKLDAGIAIAGDLAFYRVSEAEDSRDWNDDGLETGYILFRTSLGRGISAASGPMNSVPGRPAVEFDTEDPNPRGAAFLADEHYQGSPGTDFDGDGDKTDLVVTYFLF